MMKKVVSVVLVGVLCVTIAGCEKESRSTATDLARVEEPASNSAADIQREAGDDLPASDSAEDLPASFDPETDEPLDGNKEYGVLDDEDLGTGSGKIPDDLEDQPASDALEEAEEATITPQEAKGIIACEMTNLYGGGCTYTLSAIDPASGAHNHINSFATDSVPGSDYYYTVDNVITGNGRERFSYDLDKLATTKHFVDTGATHAGWLDSKGNFFDVNESVGDIAKSEFEDIDSFEAVGFTDDGIFAYVSRHDNKYYYIDLSSPDQRYEGNPVEATYDLGLYNFYTDQIDGNTYLIDDDNSSMIYDTDSGERKAYIPGDTMSTRSAVMSPDKASAAFIASSKKQEAGTPFQESLYIMQFDGSSYPEQVNCSDDIELTHVKIIDWR